MRGPVQIFLLCCAGLLVACEVEVPTVTAFSTVVPHLAPPSDATARAVPSIEARALAEGEAQAGSCLEWQTELDRYDRVSGEFEVIYRCVEGGQVERIHTQGVDHGDGTGAYTTVYELRDGGRVIWQFRYAPDPVDPGTTVYTGTSNQGGSFEGEYRKLSSGQTSLREVYAYAGHVFVVEGLSDDDGRFNGRVTYDDLGTELSPDWILVQVEQHDGTVQQTLDSTTEGWGVRETITLHPDGSLDYAFRHDDLASAVFPDFEGRYTFADDGSGEGGYLQRFDDGSTLDVSQQIQAQGDYLETWRFDDALSALPAEQEGALQYSADGHGQGHITTYVVGGSAETCDLEVFADGSTVIDNCRS